MDLTRALSQFAAAVLVASTALTPCFGQAVAEKAPAPPANLQPELKYEGQPLSHWKREFTQELKPELRLKPLQALITFGSNGFADEVVPCLVSVLNSFDESDEERLGAHFEKFTEAAEARVAGDAVDPGEAIYLMMMTGIAQAAAQQQQAVANGNLPVTLTPGQFPVAPVNSGMMEAKLIWTAMNGYMKVGMRSSPAVLMHAIQEGPTTGLGRLYSISFLAARSDSEEALLLLLKIVGSAKECEQARDGALNGLIEHHAPADSIVVALTPLATSKNPELRAWAMTSLGKVTEAPESAKSILLTALDDKNAEVVIAAARSLQKLESFPREKTGLVVKLLSARNEAVRQSAGRALDEAGLFQAYRGNDLKEFNVTAGDLHNSRLVVGYSQLLNDCIDGSYIDGKDVSPGTTLAVFQILGELGPQASDSVRAVKRFINTDNDRTTEFKTVAQETLEKISPTAKK